eukprot:767228-Hanusia_phi.AAC.3
MAVGQARAVIHAEAAPLASPREASDEAQVMGEAVSRRRLLHRVLKSFPCRKFVRRRRRCEQRNESTCAGNMCACKGVKLIANVSRYRERKKLEALEGKTLPSIEERKNEAK